jgi:uncharacterized protein
MRLRRRLVITFALLGAVALNVPAGVAPAASAGSPDLVISQAYGGGGNTGAPYDSKFVELFNRGTAAASVAGMSIQYASATGTAHFATNVLALPDASVPAGGYFLVRLVSGTNGSPLPEADASGTINPAAGSGKLVLARTTVGLACNGGSAPCNSAQLAVIADLVGYGSANWFEGSGAAPTLSNTTAALRRDGGCTDTDDNAADFTSGAPTPRNSASTLNPCSAPEPTTEPPVEPTTEPTTDPTADPTTQPSTEPTTEPTTDPTADPTAQPSTEPTAEPTIEPTHVPFDFSGFLAPVANPPSINTVKAGSAVVLHFSLGGYHGLDIVADGYPSSARRPCVTSSTDSNELATSPGRSGLSYDFTSDMYTFAWKTDRAWAGTCRQLSLRLVDGTTAHADFSFR